ncbi:MAG: nuclear transport factor 2 family protein [Aureibaculum sp.]
MKKLILLGIAIITLAACQKQEQRYFAESAEINTLKSGIEAYETGDWDKWKGHFSDTAKIYVNSATPVDVNTRMEELKGAAEVFSTYGFDKKDEFIEMVIDKEKETWVYYWAQWNGVLAANSKKISVPVHLAIQFTDGKITKEHIYFDGTEMNKELEALANMSEEDETIPEE